MRKIKIPIRRPWIPYVILVISLLITILATLYVLRGTNQFDQLRFESITNDTQKNIENKVNVYITLLRGTAGLIAAEPNISQQAFSDFITRLSIEKNYPGIQGIGYIKKINSSEKDAFIQEQQATRETFSLWPDTQKDVYFPIVYIEPSTAFNNSATIGFDVSSEIIRNIALNNARDSGSLAATSKVMLGKISNQPNQQPGFIMYIPVYQTSTVPADISQRRNLLTGFVYAPFRTYNLFRDVSGNNVKHLINYQIYDGTSTNTSTLLYDSKSSQKTILTNNFSRYTTARKIDIAGKTWTIVFSTDTQFEKLSQRGLAPIILLGGLIISFILFLLSRSQYIARSIAEDTALQLRTSQKELQKAIGLRDNFMSIASHELKTPVTSLKVYTEVLLKNFLASNNKKASEYMQKMNKQIDKLTLLIQDLLDVSRLQAGKLAFREDYFSLPETVQEAVENIIPVAGNHKIIIKGTVNDLIWGDKERIGQVINNFLSNAIKYSPKSEKVVISMKDEIDGIRVSVQDFGIGIKEKHLKKIFSRFYRVADTNQLTYPGLGMGLYICNEIIKRHNGKIYVRSQIGKGSTFSFFIPTQKRK